MEADELFLIAPLFLLVIFLVSIFIIIPLMDARTQIKRKQKRYQKQIVKDEVRNKAKSRL